MPVEAEVIKCVEPDSKEIGKQTVSGVRDQEPSCPETGLQIALRFPELLTMRTL